MGFFERMKKYNYNDVIETTLLNALYAGNFKTMLPKFKSANFTEMELIRPLYYVEEEYIKRFTNNAGIWPLNCACMVAAEKIIKSGDESDKRISK